MEVGFVKLWRSLREWEWYGDYKTKDVFIELLLTANYEPNRWRGQDIEIGQTVTSYPQLAKTLGFSIQNVRTSINRLKSTGEITVKTHSKFSIITITNWETYQPANREANSHLTGIQQSSNNTIRSKEIKKERNNPPDPPNNSSASNLIFGKFKDAYPSKMFRIRESKKIWAQENLAEQINDILAGLEAWKVSDGWQKEKGRYIPTSTTFLENELWLCPPERGEPVPDCQILLANGEWCDKNREDFAKKRPDYYKDALEQGKIRGLNREPIG